MFEFLKRRKVESAKREAIEIGSAAVKRINAGMAEWRAKSLEMRRTMVEDFFAERLVEIQPEDEMSYEMVAEIEALAAMKNWYEMISDSAIPEAERFVDQADHDIMAVVGIEGEIDQQLKRNIDEVTTTFETNLNDMIREAIERRGETPTSQS